MHINISNIEELFFLDSVLCNKFPEFEVLINQWKLGKRIPALRFISQDAALSLLNKLKSEHLKILESYFQEEVEVGEIDKDCVKNFSLALSEAEEKLNNLNLPKLNYNISRGRDKLEITYWR